MASIMRCKQGLIENNRCIDDPSVGKALQNQIEIGIIPNITQQHHLLKFSKQVHGRVWPTGCTLVPPAGKKEKHIVIFSIFTVFFSRMCLKETPQAETQRLTTGSSCST